ncbi:MAG: hypothetical protein IPJ49_26430 [Candidatus Obscuribacter sp.]|nr:hypothetical protein [Candidatus Obscuribacter sp.]
MVIVIYTSKIGINTGRGVIELGDIVVGFGTFGLNCFQLLQSLIGKAKRGKIVTCPIQ